METPRFVFYLLLALAVLQVLVYYPMLPETVASHFDGSGRADGWSSKSTFFTIDAAVIALTALIFLGLSKIRWPDRWVSLPHKDYWLAPERRERTFRELQRQMLVFGCATMVVLLVVMQWTIEANLDGSQTLPAAPMWWLMGGYLLFTAVWTTRLVVRLRRVPDSPPDSPPGSPPE